MIGKINSGSNIKGLLEYIFKIDSELIDKSVLNDSINGITYEFKLVTEHYKNIEKPIKHFVISFSPEDEKHLNSELLKKITDSYLEKMGYSNNQHVVVKHNDTDTPHIHIVVNRIDRNIKPVSDSFEKMKSRIILKSLEKQYQLKQTADTGKGVKNIKPIEEGEIFKTDINGNTTCFSEYGKSQLIKNIYSALNNSKAKSFKELNTVLGTKEIGLNLKNNNKLVRFKYGGIEIPGGELSQKLSRHYLEQKFRLNICSELRSIIKSAVKSNMVKRDEFFNSLRNQGIEIHISTARNGYSFHYLNQKFKSSAIDRNLTLLRIDKTLETHAKINCKKYVQKQIIGYLKNKSDISMSDWLSSKGIVYHSRGSNNGKFLINDIVIPEMELSGPMFKNGLEKVNSIKSIQNCIKGLLTDGVDHRYFIERFNNTSDFKVLNDGEYQFISSNELITERDLKYIDLDKELAHNFIRNSVTDSIGNSLELTDFENRLESEGIECRIFDGKYEFTYNSHSTDLGLFSQMDFIESQLRSPIESRKNNSTSYPISFNKSSEYDDEEEEIKKRNKNKGMQI